MSKKREYVFVTWDPLLERVLCVHKKQDSTCEVCDRVARKNSKSTYWIESKKLMIKE